MNKTLSIFMALMALFTGSLSFAREFYQIDVKVDLTYTNIDNGTVGIFQNQPAQIRFSDDSQFCRFYAGGESFNCVVEYLNNGNIDYTRTYMIKTNWQAYFNELQGSGVLRADYNDKLQRILGDCKNCNYRTTDWDKIYYQIDDAQPEAFHLLIHDQNKARKM